MVTISHESVQEVYGEKEPSLDEAKQIALTRVAERLTDDVFGGRVGRLTEIEGDTDDFAKYLAAHLWFLSEGQSLNEEFQTGNAGPRDIIGGDTNSWLSGSVYGVVCQGMLRQGTSISVVRTDI